MRIAVIGSGVSGIAAAKTLARLGHDVIVFEKGTRIGGHWALAYPGVRLQNMAELYAFTDFPWPFVHDDYPPANDILRYLEAAVAHFGLDIRVEHEVLSLAEADDGWVMQIRTPHRESAERFDAVVVATGHYMGERAAIALTGRERFKGRILTEHEIGDLSVFDGRRVAVVGFGKAAVDVLSFAVGRARELHHVFRQARWLLPRMVLGQPTSRLSTERMSVTYASSWVYPTEAQRRFHAKNPRAGAQTDSVTSYVLRVAEGLRGLKFGGKAKARLKLVDPGYPIGHQLRGTLAPDNYFPSVARGIIEPHASAVTGFSEDALLLADGSAVPADVVVLSVGYKRPAMPFLPEPVRGEFADDADGTQLYRHLVHPQLKRLAFAGFNHNPLHIPSAEIGALWIDAMLSGDLALPPPEAMAQSAARVRDWKRANTLFEPTRAYWVGGHLHNYLDVLLTELGLEPHRKRGKWREAMEPYRAADYATIIDEYLQARGTARRSLPFDT